uniref:HEPN domain-containing protein n=1 Tax=Ignisphaera aggregans TaxID=334771 RepID=A0A7C5TM54_9CREN
MVSRMRDWIRQSRRNLASAIVNYREGLYEEVCFESHQVGEKAVRGLLNFFHRERRGHSITFMLSELGLEVPVDIRECASLLDKHYIPARYPDVFDEGAPMDYYSSRDAEECIKCAEKILKWVEKIVGEA